MMHMDLCDLQRKYTIDFTGILRFLLEFHELLWNLVSLRKCCDFYQNFVNFDGIPVKNLQNFRKNSQKDLGHL